MNNISSFEQFSKGESKISQEIVEDTTNLAPDSETKEPIVKASTDTKHTSMHGRIFGKTKPHQEIKDVNKDMKPFKDSYEKIETEYLSLIREMNRMESKKPDLKKDVTELKKNFNDLLVKLQYLAEWKQKSED